jgi:hypothetical protein
MTHKHRILAVVLLGAPIAGGTAAAWPKQPPPDSAVPKELLDLRAKLLSTEREQARADAPRFRALCDADGYPLVGNIANKASRYQPSELCADLRQAAKK